MFLKIFLQKFAHENNVDSYLKILTLCSKCYFIASYLVLNFKKKKTSFMVQFLCQFQQRSVNSSFESQEFEP